MIKAIAQDAAKILVHTDQPTTVWECLCRDVLNISKNMNRAVTDYEQSISAEINVFHGKGLTA